MKLIILATSVMTVLATTVQAENFVPLTAPATLANTNENTNPFLLPSGWTQTKIVDRNTLSSRLGSDGSSFPAAFGNWDMMATANNYIYIPMEVSQGAGVIRYDRNNGSWTPLMTGNNTGTFISNPVGWSHQNDDFGTFDSTAITPSGSMVVAEEWSGNGRIFEVTNPSSANGTATATVNWLNNIPSVSHEGIKFDSPGNMYFIDENSSGSIYRFTPKNAGDLSVGKTSVLKVDVGQTGSASWVDITDIDNSVLTTADPFDFNNRGGRAAADEVGGTAYNRPEDLEIGQLANGNEALYIAVTGEDSVYALDLLTTNVTEFVSSFTTPDNIGNDPVGDGAGTAVNYGLNTPDNLAIGPDGTIFIIEDQNPGDIWAARDEDGDGVAESIDLFASLGPFGSEPSGFIYDAVTGGYLVNIQHPSSGNDALWLISETAPVPVPAAVWLFGSSLIGLIGIARRDKIA